MRNLKKALLLLCLSVFGCGNDLSVLKQEGVYFLLMKGDGKMSEYIVDFNEIENKKYSHVVIFVNQTNESKAYHILPSKNSCVIKQDIGELLAEDIKMIEIWRLEIDKQQQNKLSFVLDSIFD